MSIWSCVLQVCIDCTFRPDSTNLCRFQGILQSLGPQLLGKSSPLQCRFEKCSGSCLIICLISHFHVFLVRLYVFGILTISHSSRTYACVYHFLFFSVSGWDLGSGTTEHRTFRNILMNWNFNLSTSIRYPVSRNHATCILVLSIPYPIIIRSLYVFHSYSLCSLLCLLSAVCCLLSAVCCLLSAVCCLLSAVCCLLSAVCCLYCALCNTLCPLESTFL